MIKYNNSDIKGWNYGTSKIPCNWNVITESQ